MPNLIYYKDSSGVASGPLKEEEATALLNANFFRPDHVFRSVDSQEAENFMSIDDLRSLNGAETPFGRNGEQKEEKELVRVYKELSTVLQKCNELEKERDSLMTTVMQERNELKQERDILEKKDRHFEEMKKRLIEQFKQTINMEEAFSVGTVLVCNFCHCGFTPGRHTCEKHQVKKCRITNNSSTSVRCLIADSWDPATSRIVPANGHVDFDTGKSNIYIAPHISDDPHDVSEHVYAFNNHAGTTIKFK